MRKSIIVLIALAVVVLGAVISIIILAVISKNPSHQKKELEREYNITLPADVKIVFYSTQGLFGYPISKLQISDDDVVSMKDMVSKNYHEPPDYIPIMENAFVADWNWPNDMQYVTRWYNSTFTPRGSARTGNCEIYFVKTPTGENYLYLSKMD